MEVKALFSKRDPFEAVGQRVNEIEEKISQLEEEKESLEDELKELVEEETRSIVDIFFDSPDLSEIAIDEKPETESWALQPLYKEDAIGNMRIWQIGFNASTEELYFRYGLVKTRNFIPGSIKVETNQSNRTLQEQALLQARRKYMDKFIEELYRPAGMEKPMAIKAALANKYEPMRVKKWPVAVNCKCDGERMMCSMDLEGKLQFKSRTNRSINLPHFHQELSIFMRYLPNCILDGELYTHGYKPNQIRSIVSTRKNGTHPLLPTIMYYMFDIYYPENPPYEYRYNRLLSAYKRYIEDGHKNLVFNILACSLAYNDSELKKFHDFYVSKGYEGLIIRKLAGKNPTPKEIRESIYRDSRTNNLLKYKEFFEEEGPIVDMYDGEGKEKGLANFKVQDPRGNILGVHPAETVETRREWFQQGKAKFLGRMYTYRYFETSEYGVPRFPVGKGFRDFMD